MVYDQRIDIFLHSYFRPTWNIDLNPAKIENQIDKDHIGTPCFYDDVSS